MREITMNKIIKTTLSTVLICALGAMAGLVGAKSYQAVKPDHVAGDYSAQRAQSAQSSILLGAITLSKRAYLEARGIPFADLGIERSNQAEQWMLDLGAKGVPIYCSATARSEGIGRTPSMLPFVRLKLRGNSAVSRAS